MKILLAFDTNFPVDQDRLIKLIQKKSKFIEFDLYTTKFTLPSGLVAKPKTFTNASKQLKKVSASYDKVFCFTEKQYDDNYFFHEHNDLTIFSFYAWGGFIFEYIMAGLFLATSIWFVLAIWKSRLFFKP